MIGGALVTGALNRASSLISTKVLVGIFVGAMLVMGAALWKAGHDRDVAQKLNTDITTMVEGVAGIEPGKLKPKQVIATLSVIKVDLSTARRERDNFKSTAATQTKRVRELGEETARLKAQSNAAVAQVRVVTQQRDRWIVTAKEASERTERLPDNTELKQMEDVLDALFAVGF